jgi:hypothetical protein
MEAQAGAGMLTKKWHTNQPFFDFGFMISVEFLI